MSDGEIRRIIQALTWFTAECAVCPPKDGFMPFVEQRKRDRWAAEHAAATGHPVVCEMTWAGYRLEGL